jgi:hypothetical protein
LEIVTVFCAKCVPLNIDEAKRTPKNNRVQMADGVSWDEKEAIERLIEYLKSESNGSAERPDKIKKLWLQQADAHPWVRMMNKFDFSNIISLICLSVDVNNEKPSLPEIQEQCILYDMQNDSIQFLSLKLFSDGPVL